MSWKDRNTPDVRMDPRSRTSKAAEMARRRQAPRRTTSGDGPLAMRSDKIAGLMINAPDFQSCHTVEIQTHSSLSAIDNFGLLDAALQDANLVAQCEDLQLERGTAARPA